VQTGDRDAERGDLIVAEDHQPDADEGDRDATADERPPGSAQTSGRTVELAVCLRALRHALGFAFPSERDPNVNHAAAAGSRQDGEDENTKGHVEREELRDGLGGVEVPARSDEPDPCRHSARRQPTIQTVLDAPA
jgi:hypothetical protein